MRSIALAAFVCLSLAPLASEAQPAAKLYRIGLLETRSAALNATNLEAFRLGLSDLGYREGQNDDSSRPRAAGGPPHRLTPAVVRSSRP
jgi:hypothetical protein